MRRGACMLLGIPGFVLAAISMAVTGPVMAQEQFLLGENDTWDLERRADPGTPEGGLALAQRALAAGDHKRAVSLATDWLQRHKHASMALEARKARNLVAEALLVRGDALSARGDYYKALYDYEVIGGDYPDSDAFVPALEGELSIARLFAHGLKRKFLGMRIVKATDVAEELFLRIQQRQPNRWLAEEAGMELGDLYSRRGEMTLAIMLYTRFIELHPASPRIAEARDSLAAAHLATVKGPEFDAIGLIEARSELHRLAAMHPGDTARMGVEARLVRIDESEAQQLLHVARWYYRRGDPIAAELALRRLRDRHPSSAAYLEGLELAVELLPELPQAVIDSAPDYRAEHVARRAQRRPQDPSS